MLPAGVANGKSRPTCSDNVSPPHAVPKDQWTEYNVTASWAWPSNTEAFASRLLVLARVPARLVLLIMLDEHLFQQAHVVGGRHPKRVTAKPTLLGIAYDRVVVALATVYSNAYLEAPDHFVFEKVAIDVIN